MVSARWSNARITHMVFANSEAWIGCCPCFDLLSLIITKVKNLNRKNPEEANNMENSILPTEPGAKVKDNKKNKNKKGVSMKSINVEEIVLTDQLTHKKMAELKNLYDVGNLLFQEITMNFYILRRI